MEDRSVLIGGEARTITCGVPQGSVIGPTLWNVFYDELLELPMPQGVELIGFADDIVVTAIGHNNVMIEELVNPVLDRIHE